MESPSFTQTLRSKDWRFRTATTLEDVLCFSTMVSANLLHRDCDVEEARLKWLEEYEGDCPNCPANASCIASIINE